MFECLPCAEGCESCVDKRPCIVSLNWVMRTIILVLSCIIILFLPVIVFFTWKYGNVKVVRAASPVLLRFITLGAFFIYCTPIVMYPTPNLGTCTLRVWLREIGFSLTYGALMLKTWRISVIFHVRSAKPIRITDFDLLKRLGMIVGVFCVFLIIRTLVAPPVVITGRTADDLKAYLCRTDWWDHSFTSLEVLFLIWGIRLCIVVRKAPSEFNESRFISMAIYNEFLLTVFLKVSMLFLQKPANPDLLYIIFFCHTQLTVTLLLCLIFGSKVYIVFRNQGKLEETSSTISRPQTTTFLVKPKSANSQQNPSTQSSAFGKLDAANCEFQEEFRQICSHLESMKERYLKLGNKMVVNQIVAMQEAAKVDFSKAAPEQPEKNATTTATTTPQQEKPERNSTGSEKSVKNGEPEPEKNPTAPNANEVRESPKSHCHSCGGKVKKMVNAENTNHVNRKECKQCAKDEQTHPEEDIENSGSDFSPTNKGRLRSGHARTHSIIINLDDNNRFTDEVTV
ncbi:UNVERIFIED_CONTAM: hypothetical protein PYX00_000765 [Menopon gallinae]|uniref:G-protein coupled receptors family 3 profile domain-containing protein n=1 Tax=Menopon gallinae TaxID=328185 RepID=A0AAW2IB52_9NEOP